MASLICFIYGSSNDLPHVQRQAITRTNTDYKSIKPWLTNFHAIKKNQTFTTENAIANVVCKMSAILFRFLFDTTFFPETY